MITQTLLESVFALPTVDRIELLKQLKDNLLSDPEVTPLNEAHRQLLDARLVEFERDPLAGTSWEEVERRLRASQRLV